MGIRLVGDRLMFKKALQELQKHARMVKRSKAIWYVATGALLRAAAAFASGSHRAVVGLDSERVQHDDHDHDDADTTTQ